MIKPEVFASPEGRQQFLQEVEAMARLDHPNVVQFCDADQFNDTYYFAMEYVDGTDLGKVVRLCGPLPVHDACDYIRQAALGLQHAHERNLIHRDIKPVNLFLTHESLESSSAADLLFATRTSWRPCAGTAPTQVARPIIKILDWGLACLRNPNGVNGVPIENSSCGVVGTADYLSPEQARDPNTVDIRGDIYSLGCSLYFLLTGQAPFPDGSLMHKIMQHQQGEPRGIERIPQGRAGGDVGDCQANDGEAAGGPFSDAGIGWPGAVALHAKDAKPGEQRETADAEGNRARREARRHAAAGGVERSGQELSPCRNSVRARLGSGADIPVCRSAPFFRPVNGPEIAATDRQTGMSAPLATPVPVVAVGETFRAITFGEMGKTNRSGRLIMGSFQRMSVSIVA